MSTLLHTAYPDGPTDAVTRPAARPTDRVGVTETPVPAHAPADPEQPGTPPPGTGTSPPGAERPGLRVVRPPVLEPPYDDDPRPPRHLRLIRGADPAVRPAPRRRPPASPAAAPVDRFAPQPTPRRDLPEPGRYAAQLVQAALEVVGGRRPLQQLMPHLTEESYLRLSARLARMLRSRPGPARTAPQVRHRVLSARVCEPQDGVAEVSLVVRFADRTHAVAVRLEGTDGRWRCPVLELL